MAKLMMMKVSELVPSMEGTAWKFGDVDDGELRGVVLQLFRRGADEHVAGKEGVPAFSVMTRTGRRCSLSAPAKQSCTNRSLPWM